MEDIDSLVRLNPMEQVHYEKEQNLYSIIKTVEYLVSFSLQESVSVFNVCFFRNLLTHQARFQELSTTISSVRFSISTNFARSQSRISADLTNLWISTIFSIASQPSLYSRRANPTTEVKKLTETWLNECLILLLSSLRLKTCLPWTSGLLTSSCQP